MGGPILREICGVFYSERARLSTHQSSLLFLETRSLRTHVRSPRLRAVHLRVHALHHHRPQRAERPRNLHRLVLPRRHGPHSHLCVFPPFRADRRAHLGWVLLRRDGRAHRGVSGTRHPVHPVHPALPWRAVLQYSYSTDARTHAVLAYLYCTSTVWLYRAWLMTTQYCRDDAIAPRRSPRGGLRSRLQRHCTATWVVPARDQRVQTVSFADK
jgi:hypothetical protein